MYDVLTISLRFLKTATATDTQAHTNTQRGKQIVRTDLVGPEAVGVDGVDPGFDSDRDVLQRDWRDGAVCPGEGGGIPC